MFKIWLSLWFNL